IQAGLGRFFAGKLRAAVLYTAYERTGNKGCRTEALVAMRAAQTAWEKLSGDASGIYLWDVTYGKAAQLRGHWADRIRALQLNSSDMLKQITGQDDKAVPSQNSGSDAIVI